MADELLERDEVFVALTKEAVGEAVSELVRRELADAGPKNANDLGSLRKRYASPQGRARNPQTDLADHPDVSRQDHAYRAGLIPLHEQDCG
jgi:hypothetical protein